MKKLCILLLLVLLPVLAGCEEKESPEPALEDLRSGTEFQYGALAWEASPEEILARLPKNTSLHYKRGPFPLGYAYYINQGFCSIDGRTGDLLLDFRDDRLQIVRFSFWLKAGDETWYNILGEELIALYGPADEILGNVSVDGTITTRGYKWNGETTTMQLVLQYGEGIAPSVTLSLGKR